MLGAIVKREPGFELVGEAEDAGQAVELALRRRPDVVLLDVDMPGGGGARAAVEIREGLPEVRIVAISADDSQGSQYDMMRAGAVGFVTKGASDDEILRVIRSSAAGSDPRVELGVVESRDRPRAMRLTRWRSGGKSPVMRMRRRSRTSRWPPPVEPGRRRSFLRRSTMTVTLGSSS